MHLCKIELQNKIFGILTTINMILQHDEEQRKFHCKFQYNNTPPGSNKYEAN